MKTEKVLQGIKIIKIHGELPVEITAITDDSEKTQKGCLFFARKGNNCDGANYIEKAVRGGAIAVIGEKFTSGAPCFIEIEDADEASLKLVENFYGSPQKKMKIVGVVGTNGKTSVCHILSKILNLNGVKTGVIGTIGAYSGEKKENIDLTTPGRFELFRLLKNMLCDGDEVVVMEVSAHAIAQRRANGLFFETLIFTNCTEDHLDYFKDFESYAAVKKSIFDGENAEYKIINADDPLGDEMIKEGKGKIISYGIYNPSDVFAINIEEKPYGVKFALNLMDYVSLTEIQLIGEHNLYNSLAALSVAAVLGVNARSAVCALERVKPIEGRCELIAEKNGGKIFLDYAHTPDGLKRTISALKKICKGKLVCLFGCGGNREKEKRGKMGEISSSCADFTVITDDNPRFENPEEIRAEIEKGALKGGGEYINLADRRAAIEFAVKLLCEGDILLIAGKGAEKYQEIKGVKYDFSDEKEVRKILRKYEVLN